MNLNSTFLQGPALSDAIRALTLAESKTLKLAVAYWGGGGAELIGLNESPAIQIQILCDPWKGSCHPDLLQSLLKSNNVKVRYVENLHSKVYLGTDSVIVGSSNASSNGIGSVQNLARYKEAAIASSSIDLVKAATIWFDDLFEGRLSNALGDNHLNEIRQLWELAQRNRASNSSGDAQLVTVLDNDPNDIDSRGIYVLNYEDCWKSQVAEVEDEKLSRQFVRGNILFPARSLAVDFDAVDSYEDEKAMLKTYPWNSTIVDLAEDARRPRYWTIGSSASAKRLKNGWFWIPVYSSREIYLGKNFRVSISSADIQELRRRWIARKFKSDTFHEIVEFAQE